MARFAFACSMTLWAGDLMQNKWDRLTPDRDAVTVLHYRLGQLWLDTDIGEADGICIAIGTTRNQIIHRALIELDHRVCDLRKALD